MWGRHDLSNKLGSRHFRWCRGTHWFRGTVRGRLRAGRRRLRRWRLRQLWLPNRLHQSLPPRSRSEEGPGHLLGLRRRRILSSGSEHAGLQTLRRCLRRIRPLLPRQSTVRLDRMDPQRLRKALHEEEADEADRDENRPVLQMGRRRPVPEMPAGGEVSLRLARMATALPARSAASRMQPGHRTITCAPQIAEHSGCTRLPTVFDLSASPAAEPVSWKDRRIVGELLS